MRKQNHSIPPVPKHDSRLNNSVVSRHKRKRPNAQKAGIFAAPLILRGEDPRDFEALHSAWVKEWTPSGPSEERLVFGCADAEWRKLRSRRFAEAKAISNSLNPAHPAFDEACALITFGYIMCREPETAFAEHASRYLRADKIRHLNQKFPRQNFASTADWAAAVVEDIKSDLHPGTPGFAALDPDRLDPATEALLSCSSTRTAVAAGVRQIELDFRQWPSVKPATANAITSAAQSDGNARLARSSTGRAHQRRQSRPASESSPGGLRARMDTGGKIYTHDHIDERR
jgi:hypothetical protein